MIFKHFSSKRAHWLEEFFKFFEKVFDFFLKIFWPNNFDPMFRSNICFHEIFQLLEFPMFLHLPLLIIAPESGIIWIVIIITIGRTNG